MKYIILTICLLTNPYCLLLCSTSNYCINMNSDTTQWELLEMEEEKVEEHVFLIVDKMPRFQGGGTRKFQKFVYGKLKYPEEARLKEISGKVVVRFVVNQRGYVEDVEIIKSAHPLLDKEAIRVVKSSPRWKPGKHMGRHVKVQFVFPITFVLQ